MGQSTRVSASDTPLKYNQAGEIIAEAQTSGSNVKFDFDSSNNCLLKLTLKGNEKNPLLDASGITYKVQIEIDKVKKIISWEGEHDRFPSHHFFADLKLEHKFSHRVAGTNPFHLLPPFGNEKFKGSKSYK